MQVLRTPDERFEGLDGFPFTPNYVEVDDGDGGRLRIHYLDEGPKDGEIVLCMHGQPSWSYLYRKMIPVLVDAGLRVIAPDLVGFGRSDKPAARSDYTYARHVHWIEGLVKALDLEDVTLVCQDWGGLIGLRVLTQNPDRFARVVVANTGLPDAKGLAPEMAAPMRELFAGIPALPPAEMGAKLRENEFGAGFMYWIKYCAEYPDFKIRDVMQLSSGGRLTEAQMVAYDAPFPDESYKQGARQFPSLVPIFPDDPAIEDNRAAWKVLEAFDKPLLTAFSDSDPVTAGAHVRFQESVPGARGQCHVTLHGAGHFLQEDAGETLAGVVIGFCRANPR
ncbi:MAG TPA: haloalkane dehalogenase [Pseudomonadales bacterium]|nr:haloalkane dehalogenase [Pseudomonadales bacterium]